MKIEVEGTELTVTADRNGVTVSRVIGRDRIKGRALTRSTTVTSTSPIDLIGALKRAAKFQTERCTCDYGRGWSGHAEHCRSIYLADYREEHGYD